MPFVERAVQRNILRAGLRVLLLRIARSSLGSRAVRGTASCYNNNQTCCEISTAARRHVPVVVVGQSCSCALQHTVLGLENNSKQCSSPQLTRRPGSSFAMLLLQNPAVLVAKLFDMMIVGVQWNCGQRRASTFLGL